MLRAASELPLHEDQVQPAPELESPGCAGRPQRPAGSATAAALSLSTLGASPGSRGALEVGSLKVSAA